MGYPECAGIMGFPYWGLGQIVGVSRLWPEIQIVMVVHADYHVGIQIRGMDRLWGIQILGVSRLWEHHDCGGYPYYWGHGQIVGVLR